MNRNKLLFAIIILSVLLSISTLAAFGFPLLNQNTYLALLIKNWPSANPTPPASPAQVLPDHFAYVTSTDRLHIVGEVRNNSAGPLQFIKVMARINSSSGQLLVTEDAYLYLYVLSKGEKSCFDISLDAPDGWASYTLDAPTYLTGGSPLTGLVILNEAGLFDPSTKWYEITGQIRNDRSNRVEYVSSISTLYNSAGKFVGCDFAFVTGNHLDPGQTSPFEIVVTGRDFSDVSSYRLQVNGTPK